VSDHAVNGLHKDDQDVQGDRDGEGTPVARGRRVMMVVAAVAVIVGVRVALGVRTIVVCAVVMRVIVTNVAMPCVIVSVLFSTRGFTRRLTGVRIVCI
jgi:hypothetical protein